MPTEDKDGFEVWYTMSYDDDGGVHMRFHATYEIASAWDQHNVASGQYVHNDFGCHWVNKEMPPQKGRSSDADE